MEEMFKKIIYILILSVLLGCAPQTRLVKVQRVKMYKGNEYIIGPAVQIKLTDKQLNKLLESESKIKETNKKLQD